MTTDVATDAPTEVIKMPTERGGRTRWLRFLAVLAAGGVGAGVLMVGMSQGALAASFAVSGTSFKSSADALHGQGLVQFGGVDQGAGAAHPVVVNGFRSATLDNFCQSVFMPAVPVVGDVTLRITAGGRGAMSADNLVVGLDQLTGDLTLDNPQIGVDAGQLGKGPAGVRGVPGTFGIQADSAFIGSLRQTAWSTTAQTLRFKGMGMTVKLGRSECF
ncbi:DUF6230 family protein [Gandjariella thermophila]|uniref:Cholesterol esterase n=1 Tax=Gandjariella thermophila TaxID=1931992 RepID=A0A4D4JDB3_9PSEU|nr:DUF6230 family protein [Gandjariella thermophila]GDY32386.1 cholesterol esterase [Gandjariella thermophila]